MFGRWAFDLLEAFLFLCNIFMCCTWFFCCCYLEWYIKYILTMAFTFGTEFIKPILTLLEKCVFSRCVHGMCSYGVCFIATSFFYFPAIWLALRMYNAQFFHFPFLCNYVCSRALPTHWNLYSPILLYVVLVVSHGCTASP